MALRAATRGSALARWQADTVARLLGQPVEMVIISTTGDQRPDIPIAALGGQGVFVKEVQAAVLEGRADFAVHSAKDLPSAPAPGLTIAAIPERGDPRDALVGATLDGLRPGALIATGSVRRRAQLAWLRPDLTFTGLRGNIDTRLTKIPSGGAVVMAAAALQRLGREDRIAQILEPTLMVPQVAQGALAVECREDDTATQAALAPLDHGPSRTAVTAERAFLAILGGGCDLPVGAFARLADGRLELEGLLASLDGRVVLRHRRTAEPEEPADALGRAVAEHLLDNAGGAALLDGPAGRQGP